MCIENVIKRISDLEKVAPLTGQGRTYDRLALEMQHFISFLYTFDRFAVNIIFDAFALLPLRLS